MHRIDTPSAVSSMPAPGAAGTPGYFGAMGSIWTVLDEDWANDIQEELIAILTAASIAPSKTTHNQVLTALQSLFALPAFATKAQMLGGTDPIHPLNALVMAQADAPSALTDASTTAWDMSQNNQVTWTLSAAHTLAISNPLPGRYYSLSINAAGHAPTFPSSVRWGRAGAPVWSTGLSAGYYDEVILHCLPDGVNFSGSVWYAA